MDGNMLQQAFEKYGLLAIILFWFMFRVERLLNKVFEALVELVKTVALQSKSIDRLEKDIRED